MSCTQHCRNIQSCGTPASSSVCVSFFSFHLTQPYISDKIRSSIQILKCEYIFWALSNVYLVTQLNKANTSDKETSFLDLNIKVIGSDIHTSVYDKRDGFRFPIVNFPWLSDDVPRLPSKGIYIWQLVRFARCCNSV